MKILLIMLLLCGTCYAEETLHFKDASDTLESSYVMAVENPTPGSAIEIRSPEGKSAKIDFSSGEVVYSGDLPVAESARIFFDAVFAIYKKEIKPAGGKEVWT